VLAEAEVLGWRLSLIMRVLLCRRWGVCLAPSLLLTALQTATATFTALAVTFTALAATYTALAATFTALAATFTALAML